MSPITFFAPGLPKGQPRPRAFARKMGGKFVARVYDAGTAEAWKSEIAVAAKPYLPPAPIRSPVSLSLTFVMPRPKGHYRTGKHAGELRPDAALYHTAKPDFDNLAKCVADVLTALGFVQDDALIVQHTFAKLYTFGTRTGCRVELKDADTLFAISSSDVISEMAPRNHSSASFKSEDGAKSVIGGVPSRCVEAAAL